MTTRKKIGSIFLHGIHWFFFVVETGCFLCGTNCIRETCQWLKFPLNGLRAQSRVSPVVGLLPLASRPACLGMAFPPFLVKQLYRCDSVVVSSFVRAGYTTRRWGWLLVRIGYSITHQYSLYYSPTSWRNHGRPLKRLLDKWDRNGSTSGLTPWKI